MARQTPDLSARGAGRQRLPRAELPRILEIKRRLDGSEARFECALLARAGHHAAILFVAPAAMHVHGVDLPAGTVSFGHFWTDRPYNVYHWLDAQSGATIGYYVNLADDTRFEGGLLTWRDLVIDVLVMPASGGAAGGAPPLVTVLDEDEVPAALPPDTRAHMAAAKAEVLASAGALIAELEAARAGLWVAAFGPTGAGEAGP